jgi:hypothetical protein
MEKNIGKICSEENNNERVIKALSDLIKKVLEAGKEEDKQELNKINNLIIDISQETYKRRTPEPIIFSNGYELKRNPNELPSIYEKEDFEEGKKLRIDFWQNQANKLRRSVYGK